MSTDPRPVVVAAVRSPIGTSGGSLGCATVEQLAAPVIAELLDRSSGVEPAGAVLGNCMGPGGNVARVASLAGGMPEQAWALSVDQQCSSGLAAVATAAAVVTAQGQTVIAGGVESPSTAPVRSRRHAGGGAEDGAEVLKSYERAPFAPVGWPDPEMGEAADLLAQECGISRARQDEYAARSHERAVRAQTAGAFAREIAAITVSDQRVETDERPRPGFTAERLARFPAAFREGGTVTAANSCGINDAAAAVTLVDGDVHTRLGVPGLRVLGWASAGVSTATPGLGLVPASQQALAGAGLSWADIDVIEFNEAFAAQILACCDDLGIDEERVCPQGGALALGHPWGASGAVLMVRLFAQLVEQDAGRYGLAAIAGGGGQGTAVVVERCP